MINLYDHKHANLPMSERDNPIVLKFLKNNPSRIRLFALRSFGESLYHSITDASLEFGFKSF